jgi:ubiquinone/menaquinone biosynthesis C-methylase UbiE
MREFADFDARGYRTVDVRTGYGEWVTTYERTVEDAMDIALLDVLTTPPWSSLHTAADLACGTGRTGTWLHAHGIAEIDGVDLTPEMLARARARGVFRSLTEGDIGATGLETAAYDLATASLVDEHLADLNPMYREAFRLVKPGGFFVIVGYHPQFIMISGMPTHFRSASGEEIAIDTHVHLLSDQVSAALGAGWVLREMKEQLIEDEWVALKPKWERFRHHPIAFAFAWQKPSDG